MKTYFYVIVKKSNKKTITVADSRSEIIRGTWEPRLKREYDYLVHNDDIVDEIERELEVILVPVEKSHGTYIDSGRQKRTAVDVQARKKLIKEAMSDGERNVEALATKTDLSASTIRKYGKKLGYQVKRGELTL